MTGRENVGPLSEHRSATGPSLLTLGCLASASYGMWGFLEKLAAPLGPVLTNIVVYGVAFAISLIGLRRPRRPTSAALIAGLLGGGINIVILYCLLSQRLMLVYPFVSSGTVVFLLLARLFLPGEFVTEHRLLFALGIFLSILGLIVAGIAMSPMDTKPVTPALGGPALGAIISLLTGGWMYFAFVAVAKQQVPPLLATTWVFLGSFLAALVPLAWQRPSAAELWTSQVTGNAALAGVFMFIGEYCTYRAFAQAPADSQRVEQTLTVLLANSELVPIIVLSLVFLKEYSLPAILGAGLVLAGLTMLNMARTE